MNEERRARIVKLALAKSNADLRIQCLGMANSVGLTIEGRIQRDADWAIAKAEQIEAQRALDATVNGHEPLFAGGGIGLETLTVQSGFPSRQNT